MSSPISFLNGADEQEMKQRFGQTVVDATGGAKSMLSSVAKDYDQRHAERFVRIAWLTDMERAKREVARVWGMKMKVWQESSAGWQIISVQEIDGV